MKVIYCLILLLSVHSLQALAVVNIESLRTSKKTGHNGGLSLSTSNKKGNSNVSSAAAAIFHTNMTSESETLALLKHNIGHTSSIKNEENSLIHLRFGKKITTHNQWEIFIQGERNVFKKIDSKVLLGGGGRFQILTTTNDDEQIFFGSGLFYSRTVEQLNPNKIDELLRGNFYLSGNKELAKNIKTVLSGYFQPNLENEVDYYLIGEFSLEFSANESTSVLYSYNVSYDNIPPQGTQKSDEASGFSIKYNF